MRPRVSFTTPHTLRCLGTNCKVPQTFQLFHWLGNQLSSSTPNTQHCYSRTHLPLAAYIISSQLSQPQFSPPGCISSAGISTIFCAAVGLAGLLVCLGVGVVMTAGGGAEWVVWYTFTVGRLQLKNAFPPPTLKFLTFNYCTVLHI